MTLGSGGRGSTLLLLVVCTTLVIGACGGGPSTESSLPSLTTPAPTQHASPVPSVSVAPKPSMTPSPSPIASATPTPERPVAGEILAITTQRGYVNEDRANPGDRVRERSEVRTDEQGSLQFDLRNKIQRCTMVNESRINAKPSDDVLLHFIEGEVFCLTEGDPGVIVLTAGPNAELQMSDPGFLVTVDGDATTVRVARGLVKLRSTDTGGTVFLGPKSASTVVPGADPNLPELWAVGDLKDDRMRDEVNGLFNLKPDLSMPRAGDSPTLRRIADTGTIRIGMPEGVSAGDAGRFTKHFFESQGFDWNVADEYPIVESLDAPAAFQQGVVDLFVAPERVDDLGRIPFVDDPNGQRFWLHFAGDDGTFRSAQSDYLRAVAFEGGYRSAYNSGFDEEPSYSAVAALLGLDD